MLIISQNLTNYGIPIPKDAIYRINLAWVEDLDRLKDLLVKHKMHEIFLDLPIKRVKPPNNAYSLNDLVPILKSNTNVKYLAISNVESPDDLKKYLEIVPSSIEIIPKIESKNGILNITDITKILPYEKKIIMLDHDDLFSSLAKNGEGSDMFKESINQLIDFCDNNKIILLRTKGVIFSDDEKRIM